MFAAARMIEVRVGMSVYYGTIEQVSCEGWEVCVRDMNVRGVGETASSAMQDARNELRIVESSRNDE